MNTYRIVRHLSAVLLVLAGSISLAGASAATRIGNEDISRVWSRLDQPVSGGIVSRTWFWGPEPITDLHEEYYADAPGGKRLVIYFDKTRMEIDVNAEPGSSWRVTNGLLATELITGQVQLGNETFADVEPAAINIAGDPDDPNGPTYRSLSGLTDVDPLPEGAVITQTIARNGDVSSSSSYGSYQVTAMRYVPETNHAVASVFWDYMTGDGTIYQNGSYLTGPLFDNQVYGVGYPITDAYWATVRVGGEVQPVLIQAFQRRVLTYTPNNLDGWKVEAGNVGRHYRDWRASLGDLLDTHVDEHPAADDDDTETNSNNTKTNDNGAETYDENTDDCNGESVNVSENGTVKQSNSATINQSGDKQSVNCTQKNTSVQK